MTWKTCWLKKIVSKDFCILVSCKDTEMDYAQSSWQSKLWTSHSSEQLELFLHHDDSVHVSPLYNHNPNLRFMITRLAMYQMPTSYSNKHVIYYEFWVTSKWISLQMRLKWLDYPGLIHPAFTLVISKRFYCTIYPAGYRLQTWMEWKGGALACI